MTISKGRWRVKGEIKETWGVTFYDDDGVRHRRQGFKTRKLAEAWEQQKRQALQLRARSKAEIVASQTVKELCEEWLDIKRLGTDENPPVEVGTFRKYRSYLSNHIYPHLGDHIVGEICRDDIVALRSTLLTTTTRAHAIQVMGVLRQVFDRAVLLEYLPANPMAVVKIRQDKRVEHVLRMPTRAQATALLEKLSELARTNKKSWRMFECFISLIVSTGVRVSEARGLRWASVDLEGRRIIIRQRADNFGNLGPPKSAAGFRTIALDRICTGLLGQWKKERSPSPDDLVFCTSSGKPLSKGNLYSRYWRPLCVEAGITVSKGEAEGAPWGFHALRHYRISSMIAAKADIKEIQVEAGHARSSITLDTYGHLFPDDFDRRLDRADKIRASENLGQISDK